MALFLGGASVTAFGGSKLLGAGAAMV